MSLFDTFDPDSEELIKVSRQRSFREVEDFPEVVRGVPVYQFFYADDCLDGEKWDPRTLGARPASSHEQYLRIALEIAARL